MYNWRLQRFHAAGMVMVWTRYTSPEGRFRFSFGHNGCWRVTEQMRQRTPYGTCELSNYSYNYNVKCKWSAHRTPHYTVVPLVHCETTVQHCRHCMTSLRSCWQLLILLLKHTARGTCVIRQLSRHSINQSINHKSLCSIATSRLKVLQE